MSNITEITVGGITYNLKDNGAVRFDVAQALDEEQKSQARTNIGAATVEEVIAEMSKPMIERIYEVVYSANSFSVQNAYLDNNGQPVEHHNYVTSDYIRAIPGTDIEYSNLQCIINYSYVIAIYDSDKNFISNEGVTQRGGSGAAKLSGIYTLPDNAAYFRVSCFDDNSGRITYSTEIIVPEDNTWAGKKWFAFGTSITSTSSLNSESGDFTGKYAPYLVEMSSLILNDHGIAGGTIATGGTHGGSANILAEILATDVSDADLITIEGFVNDFACGVSLGNPGDNTNTTLCGAIYLAVKHCLENSNATVILITETTGRVYTLSSTGNEADYTLSRVNGANLIQNDYNDTIVKMANYMGIHVIDAGRKSQINEFKPEYLEDHIHHSHLGGKQYAATIWDELKHIHVSSDVTVE